MRLFVYGSLKRGFTAHDLLDGCQFIREAVAEGFQLYKIDWFPGMVQGTGKVYGELYDVPEAYVPVIDYFECVNQGMFERVSIELDNQESAEVYLYRDNYDQNLLVETGRWTHVEAERKA